MNVEKYTDRAKGMLQAAQTLALRRGHQRFTPDHVLYALLEDDQGLAVRLIQAAGGDAGRITQAAEQVLAKMPVVEGQGAGQVYLSPEAARLFENAEKVAKKAGDDFVTVERLLQALSLADGSA
mgnify:FL=1